MNDIEKNEPTFLEKEIAKEEEKKEVKQNPSKGLMIRGTHIKKGYLIFPLLGIVLIIVMNIFKGESTNENKQKQPEKIEETSRATPQDLNLPATYGDLAKREESEFPRDNISTSSVNRVDNNTSRQEINSSNSQRDRELSEEERDTLRKLREEALTARKSSISFNRNNNAVENAGTQYPNQPKVYPDYDDNRQGAKKNFLQNESSNEFTLSSRLTGNASPYEVKAGDFIPAIAITAMNSDLPAKVITAQIRENVFDTVTGKYLLIPQGAKVIGTYDSNVTWGQNRLLVVWQRLIFPNGDSINLHNMQGTDLTGKAGITGKVNNHFATLLKGVLLSSAMGAGAAIVTDDRDDWRSEAGKGAGETIIKIGDRFAEKALNRQPTIEIKQGERFNIMVHSDLILRPYR